ncbi:hypothetical protein GYH30_006273 [Glycine max]|nr:hypothetical protein GYH30_006273 [Glycine max]
MNLDNERVKYIHSRLSKNLGRENSVKELDSTTLPTKSDSHFGSRIYFVVVGLGTPKRDLSLIFDTGSDLTWTQCEPCAGSYYKQQDAIFDPSMSRSFLVGFVEGFTSIDCRAPADLNYTESTTRINYTSDANFINTGVSGTIVSELRNDYQRTYESVRSFPEGKRNCYKINITRGSKYLIKAGFLYGNYDGPPTQILALYFPRKWIFSFYHFQFWVLIGHWDCWPFGCFQLSTSHNFQTSV